MRSTRVGKTNGRDVRHGLNLGWGEPVGDYMGLGGDQLRDILQI